MNRKAIADAFDASSSMGYYIIGLMVLSVLLMFLAVFIQGAQTNYYTNTFGTDVISFEDRLFIILAYEEELTGNTYTKVIDLQKIREFENNGYVELNKELGIYTKSQARAISFNIFYDTYQSPKHIFTSQNFPFNEDFTKVFPVVIKDGEEYKTGIIEILYGEF